jgi:hypothetical protein
MRVSRQPGIIGMHSHPELFTHSAWQPTAELGASTVATPLGELSVRAAVDDHELRLDAATAFVSASGARLWVWDGGVFRAELLRARPQATLPAGMAVAGWEAAMWRLRATERPAECEVECRWAELPGGEPGSPHSGENLEAQGWSNQQWQVQVGLPDLGERVAYLPDGFTVRAPLARAESFAAHFVVAWAPDRPGNDSAWFAVDCTPAQILASIDPLGG